MTENIVKIVIPQETTNLVTNPSFETNTTGWSALAGGAIAQSDDQSKWGVQSLKVTPGVANDGTQSGVVSSGSSVSDVVASCWVHGNASDTYEIVVYDNTAASEKDTASKVGNGDWQRLEVASDNVAGNDLKIYVRTTSNTTTPFYVDGVQFEEWASEAITAATTYCDGDQAGCEWTGAEHAATSKRSGNTRAGGQILAVDEDSDVKLRHLDGFGMTRYSHQSQPTPLLPGALFQNVHAEPRIITLMLKSSATTDTAYHAMRKELVDRLKHSATPNVEPTRIIYNDEREIFGYYDSGLEGVLRGPFKEDIALRFVCYDPYWYERGESSHRSFAGDAVSTGYCTARVNGTWDDLDTGVNGRVRAVAYHPGRNSFFVGGDFTGAGSGPTTVNSIAEYDYINDTWNAMDSGVNAGVQDIAISPSGKVYCVGSFTTAGSGALTVNRVAEWDPSTSTWAALDNGVDAVAYSVSIYDGNIYVGGAFTAASTGHALTVNRIAYYDNVQWNAMDNGADATVNSVDAKAGGVAVGGVFTGVGTGHSTTANRIALWDPAAASWSALGSGMNGTVNKAIWSTDNSRIYATGEFTTADSTTVNYITQWNGSAWSAMGTGLNDDGVALWLADDGSLYVGGDFTSVDGDGRQDYIARWINGVWVPEDIQIPTTSQRLDAIGGFNGPVNNVLFLGYKTNGTIGYPVPQTVTNSGTADAYPRFVIQPTVNVGTANAFSLWSIKNFTTGDEVFFDLDFINGEAVTIDFRNDVKSVYSDSRSNLMYTVLAASSFSQFRLAPGDNTVVVSSAGLTTTLTQDAIWRDTYESFD